MDQEYELFERLPDGAPVWKGTAQSLQNARDRLTQLSNTTANEVFAMVLGTKQVVIRLNADQKSP